MMNKYCLSLVLTVSVMLSAPAGAQDISQGTVIAFDRKANTLVLADRTVWPLNELKGALPDGLKAGDRVEIHYQSDEDGLSSIDSISLLMDKKATGGTQVASQDVSQGTVLALDRKARTLVLVDRTVWALELLKSELPAGLKAGDRVQIEYEGDEDGISAISSISLLP